MLYIELSETIRNHGLTVTKFELDEYNDYFVRDELKFDAIINIIPHGWLKKLIFNVLIEL